MPYDCTSEQHQIMIAKAHRIHEDAFTAMKDNYDPNQPDSIISDFTDIRKKLDSANCKEEMIKVTITGNMVQCEIVPGELPGGEKNFAPNHFSVALFNGIFKYLNGVSEITFYEGKKTPSTTAYDVKIFRVTFNGTSTAYFNFSDQE